MELEVQGLRSRFFNITVSSLTVASQVISSLMRHGVQNFIYFLPDPAHLEEDNCKKFKSCRSEELNAKPEVCSFCPFLTYLDTLLDQDKFAPMYLRI